MNYYCIIILLLCIPLQINSMQQHVPKEKKFYLSFSPYYTSGYLGFQTNTNRYRNACYPSPYPYSRIATLEPIKFRKKYIGEGERCCAHRL